MAYLLIKNLPEISSEIYFCTYIYNFPLGIPIGIWCSVSFSVYELSVSSVPDVTSFDSVTVIHCRNHWHHHWRRRIHRCRASIGASGCMEGKVSKGVLNLPNGCFFYGFLRGNLYHRYQKIANIIWICLCWFLVLLRVNLQMRGMRDFPFFFIIMDTQNSNKEFFFQNTWPFLSHHYFWISKLNAWRGYPQK